MRTIAYVTGSNPGHTVMQCLWAVCLRTYSSVREKYNLVMVKCRWCFAVATVRAWQKVKAAYCGCMTVYVCLHMNT